MTNELTFIEQAERKVSTLSNERKCDHDANKLHKGNIVYKIETGMAHKIVRVSLANGIEHYSLVVLRNAHKLFLIKICVRE